MAVAGRQAEPWIPGSSPGMTRRGVGPKPEPGSISKGISPAKTPRIEQSSSDGFNLRRLASLERVIVASWDEAEVQRAAALFGPRGMDVTSLAEPCLPEPRAPERSAREAAVTKACIVASLTGLPAVKEERYFRIAALDGRFEPDLPRRFFPEDVRPEHVALIYHHLVENEWLQTGRERATEGFDAIFEMVDEVLLTYGALGPDDRQASLTSALSVAWPDNEHLVVEAHLEGQLARQRAGAAANSIESYFAPTDRLVPGRARTFAEMNLEARRSIVPTEQVYEVLSRLLSA